MRSLSEKKIRIGTRGSPLAMVQTRMVEALLKEKFPALEIEIEVITTSGDWKPSDGEVRLSSENGGKGQFAKEIEEAMLAGKVDIAVHSMKDMDSFLPDGLVIRHMLPREDVRDALILSEELRGTVRSLSDIPQAAKVGTASVRRSAFLLMQRPDVQIEPLRGNVGTRIEKVRSSQVDVSFLALAGLKRLGLEAEADVIIEPSEMLPAAGQGAVGIEHREEDAHIAEMLDALCCKETYLRVSAERAALAGLDGSCHTPIGAYARRDAHGDMRLSVQVCSLDGRMSFAADEVRDVKNVEQAQALGSDLAMQIKPQLPDGIL